MVVLYKSFLNVIFIILTFLRKLTLNKTKKAKKLLLIEIMGIGDVVCHTPFLKNIKNAKEYEIYGCFPKHFIAMQKEFCKLDGYIEYDGFFSALKQIRKSDIDCIILNARALRYAAIGLLSGKKVLGYINDYSFKFNYLNDYKAEFLGFNKKSCLVNYSKMHLAQRGNPVLEFLGLRKIYILPEKEFQPNNSDYLVIHAGADYIGRRWPSANYREIIKFIFNEFDKSIKKIYLLGGKQDFSINEQISKNIPKCINIAGEKTLKEISVLIKGARYFMGNDSGPLHMAALLNIPVIGFYGPNLPEISGPYTEKRKVFFNKFECNPCNQKLCENLYQCIRSISVSQVISFLEELES